MNRKRALRTIKDPNFFELCQAAVAEMRRLKIPGSTVGVYDRGKKHIAGFGKTSREHPLPVTPKTFFQVGSNTKPMVATAMMRLLEAGQIDLDTPAKHYLPKLRLKDKTVSETVTLRQLMNHTAGFEGDYFNDFGGGDDALRKMVSSLTRLQQTSPLGEVWSYNNVGYYIVGHVIEVVTGIPFEHAIQELVFEPLGMRRASFFPDDRIITGRYAVGHELVKNRIRIARPWAMPRAENPAGGVLASAQDLLTFARFHMGDGKMEGLRVLKAATIKQMQKPTVTISDLYQMGISWFIQQAGGMKIILHGGSTNGQNSGLWFIPEKQFALTWLTNSSETNVDELLKAALKIYFEVSIPIPEPIALPFDEVQSYLGAYENIEVILTLSEKKGKLWLSIEHKGGFPTPDSPPLPMPAPMRIGFYAKDKFLVLNGTLQGYRGEFLRTPDDSLNRLRFDLRIHKKVS